jgi:stage V sporulation protein AC
MSSSALDSKTEGFVLGIGANMFKLGGTVITYGIVSASLLGVIRYVFTLFG